MENIALAVGLFIAGIVVGIALDEGKRKWFSKKFSSLEDTVNDGFKNLEENFTITPKPKGKFVSVDEIKNTFLKNMREVISISENIVVKKNSLEDTKKFSDYLRKSAEDENKIEKD